MSALTLAQRLQVLAEAGAISSGLPAGVTENLAERVTLRPYQVAALERFRYYLDAYPQRLTPTHLLFHMATGSGKTVLMAALILDLYARGRRDFLFFVNSTQIIDKTRDNFLNPASSKYLFADPIRVDEVPVRVTSVSGFEAADAEAINIHFTTIQGLHTRMQNPRENDLTIADFKDRSVVMIADEAHHLNADTKAEKDLTGGEAEERRSWQGTVERILAANPDNMLLEFTATANLGHPAIQARYADKLIYDYPLKQFRRDGWSKDVELRFTDRPVEDRMLAAVVISQHRRKLAEANGIALKPVVMMKSRRVAESLANEAAFHALLEGLSAARLEALRAGAVNDGALSRAFAYIIDERGVSLDDLARELRLDFAPAKVANVNSPGDLDKRQIALNTLEDRNNELRVIFAVDKLNEGWDVLNLFDIVRLNDSGTAKPTTQEAQLIGRGARYYPFSDPSDPAAIRQQRKFDADPAQPLRLLEQLHYHASHSPSYITEIKSALIDSGMLDQEEKTVTLRLKPAFKETELYKSGLVWMNERITNTRDEVKGLDAYLSETRFRFPRLMTGRVVETGAFQDGAAVVGSEPVARTLSVSDLGETAVRFAMDTIEAYRFDRLKRRFPHLKSRAEFMTSDAYLGGASIEVQGLPGDLDALDARQKVEIAQSLLRQVAEGVEAHSLEHIGSKVFRPTALSSVIRDKTFKLAVEGERGRSWKESLNPDFSAIDLSDKDWHVFDDSYGTAEEKAFIRYIHDQSAELRDAYDEFYLIRNERAVHIFAFSNGERFEPDFLLFLKRKGAKVTEVTQLFVEPKGEHLKSDDQWKEDFLLQIEAEAKLEPTFEGRDFRVRGVSFFNTTGAMRKGFEESFQPFLEKSAEGE